MRDRKEDVPLLVNYFVDRYAKRAGKKIKHIQRKALEALQKYSWPGNVRELQNVIERSLIIGETTEFSIDKSWVANEPQQPGTAPTDQRANERQRIEAALAQSNGKISGEKRRRGQARNAGLDPRIENPFAENQQIFVQIGLVPTSAEEKDHIHRTVHSRIPRARRLANRRNRQRGRDNRPSTHTPAEGTDWPTASLLVESRDRHAPTRSKGSRDQLRHYPADCGARHDRAARSGVARRRSRSKE